MKAKICGISDIKTLKYKSSVSPEKSIVWIYFSSFLVWLDDSTDSLEKTMSHLDSSLEKANNFSKYLYN